MHHTRTSILTALATLGAALGVAIDVVVDGHTASAANFVVDTLSDDPADGFTLREAVEAANVAAGPDTITFAPGLTGRIELTNQLDVADSVRILGPGSSLLTIDANGISRSFQSFFPGTNLVLSGMTVTGGDTAGPGGGLVFQNGGTLDLTDVVFTGNVAAEGGAADISNVTGPITVTDVVATGNTAESGRGGGIDVDTVTLGVTLTGATIDDNTAPMQGGGGLRIEEVGGAVTVTSTSIDGNVAGQDVGGLFVDAAGPVTIADTSVDGNTSTDGDRGGASITSQSDIDITTTTFSANTAAGSFAGVEIEAAGGAALTAVNVDGNTANGLAGGAYVISDFTRVLDSTFTANTATAAGGGLAISSGTNGIEVHRTTIADNTAGGAPGLWMESAGDVLVARTTISGNVGGAGATGGGLSVLTNGDELRVVNSTISGNSTALSGGAIAANNTDVELRWSTVVDNTATGASGTFHSLGGATITYFHSIIAGNEGALYDDASPATLSASYSLVQSSPAEVVVQNDSLFGADPLLGPLADNGGPTRTHLPDPASPVVGAGDPTIMFVVGSADQRGEDRDVDVVDIGAVELQVDEFPVWLPIAPARLVDTRPGFDTIDGQFEGIGRRAAGATLKFDVAGRAGIPTDATAVVVNITGVDALKRGFVTGHGCLPTRPNVSSLNFPAGTRVGNEVIVELDGAGDLCIYTHVATDLTVDVVAYVPATSPYVPVEPARLVDTRPGFDTIDGQLEGIGRPGAGKTLTVQVTGRGGVPAGASAVLVNVTAVDAPANGFIAVRPCVPGAPTTSSVNFVAGINRGNEIVATLSATGRLCVYTHRNIHVTVDVVGYLPPGTDYRPLASPARLLDTRPGFTTADGAFQGTGRRAAGSTLVLDVAGRVGIPADAATVALNLTSTGSLRNGFATAFDCEGPRPNASSLNFRTGVSGANEIVAGVSDDGTVCIYTHVETHLVVDVSGWTVTT
jgi:hypothetical protein